MERPRRMDDVCMSCGQEYGDHKAKAPHKFNGVVRNRLVRCLGYSSVKKERIGWLEEENMEIRRADYLIPLLTEFPRTSN